MTDRTPVADVESSENGSSRRAFMIGAGVASAGALIAACGGSTTSGSSSPGASSSAAGTSGDLAIAKVAASLEVLAVGTYKAAGAAASGGKLGPVPAAGAMFVSTAMQQHQAALDMWNQTLASANMPAVTTPPADLNQTVQQMFSQVTDFGGAAKLALLLEQTAADTYLKAVSQLKGKDAIQLAGSIQIIDQQHAAILLYVLGQYPVPDVFQTGAKAYTGSGAASGGGSSPTPS